jgi:glycosyltransferase involved in cell wall biosynthesis
VSWLGYRQTGVLYHREARYAGETKYPYRKMIRFAIDGITSFSSVPLKLATWLGYAASLFGFVYACFVIVMKLIGQTVPGFASIIVSMFFIGGVQLICLGIVGEYIARIFNEIKARPIYLVEKVYSRNQSTN